ncbi:MAG: hypothetical protein ACHQX1_02415 [Candidatus Micrarchaeales archaeon]
MTGRLFKLRAQSAMEYLMTYGWAILVIAIVLSALFALGVFNSSSVATNSCIATPGFLCTGAIYSHANANIIVTVGQSTSFNWVGANFVFVPQGTPTDAGIPMISFNSMPANTVLFTNGQGLASGGEALLVLPANSVTSPIPVGTTISGTIWANYEYLVTEQGIQQTHAGYIQIAALTLKAS